MRMQTALLHPVMKLQSISVSFFASIRQGTEINKNGEREELILLPSFKKKRAIWQESARSQL
jgi:hypothetical protein